MSLKGEKNMSKVELTFHILGAIGSFISGIIVLITFIRVVSRLMLKDEVIYGTEAEKRYDEIKNKILENGIEINSNKYEGGNNKITPRLEVEKCYYNPILMKRILKGYKIKVRYFDREKNVTTWYLKSNLK
jgi:hypothetical protein